MLRATTSRIFSKSDLNTHSNLFHTSTSLSIQKTTRGKGYPFRTKLTTDLRPKQGSRPKNLEVAPRIRKPPFSSAKRAFTRDSLPHSDPEYRHTETKSVERNPSFRRESRQRNHVEDRNGQWRNEGGFFAGASNGQTGRKWQGEGKLSSGTRSSQQGRNWPSDGATSVDTGDNRSSRMWGSEGRFSGNSQASQNWKGGTSAAPGDGHPIRSRHIRHDTGSLVNSHEPVTSPSEFSEENITTTRQTSGDLPTKFTSPLLMPGILSCLKDAIGADASPTPIQALSLKWLMNDKTDTNTPPSKKQFLLASETGSGKSIAYLLPVLQGVKQAELDAASSPHPPIPSKPPKRALNPRALILAPTHELSRQLSTFAKTLLHEVKLRVLCASRANTKSTKEHDATARQMLTRMDANSEDGTGQFEVKQHSGFPVDVVVGTPMKLLEMVHGRGWDRKEADNNVEKVADEELESDTFTKPRRGRDKMIGFGKWRSKPEMGLANIDWVVVDEADVLFDPDFQETTRRLLADISSARGQPVPLTTLPSSPRFTSPPPSNILSATPTPIEYPFNFIMTSATIPSSLATYLDTYHPKLMRLASPQLHHLPKTLKTEYMNWTGGNKLADIERRIRRVWAEDATMVGSDGNLGGLSKILIFCNQSTKVDELGRHLEEQGIRNVALSSTSDQRKRGSNHHLDGFLRETHVDASSDDSQTRSSESYSDPKSSPHVMITTSLLSRGLDFSPSIRHVFIVDEPRNMIDFLHRAGRTGRAGEKGKVVVFGKLKGRGSLQAKDVRKKVGSLIAH